MLSKQSGISILESLISAAIFSIVILGSGMTMNFSMSVQKEMTVNSIITNTIQNRLQTASGVNGICNGIDTTSIAIADGQEYFLSCFEEKIAIDGIETKWPVLAAAPTLGVAITCSNNPNAAHEECYIIGR